MRVSTNVDGEIWKTRNCMTCEKLLKNYKEEFIDSVDNVFPEACVADRLSEYEVSNPEDLLKTLKEEKNALEPYK